MIKFNESDVFKNTSTYVLDVVSSNSFNDQGKYYNLCKEFLLDYTKASDIILTHSATAALELSYQLLLKNNQKVLMPSFTFSSTANAVLKNSGGLIWSDISLKNLCLDVNNAETIANYSYSDIVTPVHYGSGAADIQKLLNLSKQYKFEVIEDSAQSLGVFVDEKHVGTFGKFGVISFHNTKFIHAGFGGALLINDHSYFDEAMEIYNRGTNRHLFQKGVVNKYNWTQPGSSHGNSDINFAVLFSQLEKIDEIIEKRRNLYIRYENMAENLSEYGVKFQDLSLVSGSNYSSFYLLLKNNFVRNNLIEYLKNQSIQAQFHYIPLHSSPMGMRNTEKVELNNTDHASDSLIRLPIYPSLKKEEQDHIINSIFDYFGQN
jgi:dTDP-4-amino-4,6-dideoxygalactose transaminase